MEIILFWTYFHSSPNPAPAIGLSSRGAFSLYQWLVYMRGKSIFIDRNICVCVYVKMRVVLVRRRSLCACFWPIYIRESFNSNSSTYTPNAQDERILSQMTTHAHPLKNASQSDSKKYLVLAVHCWPFFRWEHVGHARASAEAEQIKEEKKNRVFPKKGAAPIFVVSHFLYIRIYLCTSYSYTVQQKRKLKILNNYSKGLL